MTFDAHGFVAEEAEAFGKAVVALLGEELQDVVQEFRIGVMGHVVWWLDVFADTPTGNHCGPPSTRFSRAARLHPSGVRLRSTRSASPRRGEDGGKKDNLQKQVYTSFLEEFRADSPPISRIAYFTATAVRFYSPGRKILIYGQSPSC
jgi:hypothetical protein